MLEDNNRKKFVFFFLHLHEVPFQETYNTDRSHDTRISKEMAPF